MYSSRHLQRLLLWKVTRVQQHQLTPLCRTLSQAPRKEKVSSSSNLTEVGEGSGGGQLQTSFAKQAKENAKTVGYGSVIVVGVCVTGVVLYTVFRELFSGSSPNSLFQKASDQCVQHPRVQDLLGEPIKAFGEENRRGRRRHVSFLEYQDENGKKGIRVQFYLQGIRKRGTAQLDAREDSSGNFKTRFLIVTADDLLQTTVVVEDSRER